MVDLMNTRMSPDLQLVSDYISNEKRKSPNLIEVSPPKKKIRTSSRATEVSGDAHGDRHIPLPSPSNRVHYPM